MTEIRTILGITAVLLTFSGYVPYIRDALKGVTRPHIYSWFLWGFVTSIAFTLQVSDKAGAGAFVTLAAALMCLVIFIVGVFSHGQKDIAKIDTSFLILAFIALIVWLLAKQPVISALLTAAIDMLGFIPTVRKSWNKPYSETLSFYFLNTLRFSLSLLALQRFTIITASYPTTWLFANGSFALLLIIRRQQIQVEAEPMPQESDEMKIDHNLDKGSILPMLVSKQGKRDNRRDMLAKYLPIPVIFFKGQNNNHVHH